MSRFLVFREPCVQEVDERRTAFIGERATRGEAEQLRDEQVLGGFFYASDFYIVELP